jgi:preprotein translocase SecE subunit
MFKIYKSGQGKGARLLAGFSLEALTIYGCYSLYNAINTGGWANIVLANIPGVDEPLNPPLLVTLIVFGVVSFLVFSFCWNWHKSNDFLIETELEMRKVSWPSRSELVGSSLIVVVVVTILSFVILGIDYVVALVMRSFYGGA